MTSRPKSSTTTAAEQVAGNTYLLEEIHLRLPPKSLTRSKLVSKQWLSQISNPQFIHRHSHHPNPKLLTGMFLTDDDCDCRHADFVSLAENDDALTQTIPSLGFLYDAIKPPPEEDGIDLIKVIDSCNGLLLCRVYWNIESDYDYCLCNPTTKSFRLLTTRPVHNCKYPKYVDYLAFDPSFSINYKVICTISDCRGFWELHMYSSDDKIWKKKFSADPLHPSGRGFFFNGLIYWPSGKSPHCFDVYSEEMKRLDCSLPRSPSPNPCLWTYLDLVGSRLNTRTTIEFCVGEVGSDFFKWVTEYDATSVRPLLYSFPRLASDVCDCFSDICVIEGVKEDESQLVIGIPGKLLLYNLKKKTGEEVYDLQGELGGQYGYTHVRVFEFIETLSVV